VSVEDPKDVARLREALASLESDEPHDHVDAGRIFDALHGDMSPEERQAIVDELLANPAAAQAWRLAREMPATEAAPNRKERSAPAVWRWASMAAAAVLVAGLVWQLAPWRQAEEPAYRSLESRSITSALAPGAVLSRAQPVLRWTGVDGARYRVRVLTPDLQLLDESAESPAREYTISQEAINRIARDGEILWQVEGRVPGEAVIVSPTFSIRVP
jgi:hypothetical protein